MRVGSQAFAALTVVGLAIATLLPACTTDTPDSPTAARPATAPGNTNAPEQSDAGATDAGEDSEPPTTFTPPPVCTSFTYSDWSVCHYNGTQTRTVVAGSPPGCYGGGPVLKQSCTFTPPTDGPGLYQAYCSDCHGNNKKGASASAIQNAINSNRGGMGVLSSLTPEQIALIAAAP